jgi:DNA protecting protein DprA
MNNDSKAYWLWLYLVLGPFNARFIELLDEFDDIEGIYASREHPAFLARLSKHENSVLKTVGIEDAKALAERCKKQRIEVVWYKSRYYPVRLTRTKMPPMILFVTGSPEMLEPVFAVSGVGARFSTEYGRAAVKHICEPLARAGITLISGMAYGIDAEVHKAALLAKGRTIAVLGTAIDMTYPAAHKELREKIEQNGAVISEYAPGTETYKPMFSQRNRIISGLSQAVIVFEAAKKSGTMITASWAADDGREVFAVPGSILSPHSEGTNLLIKNGAALCGSAADILEALDIDPEICESSEIALDIRQVDMSDIQRRLYDAFDGKDMTVDELAFKTGMEPHAVLAELTELEMEGVISAKGGSRYARKAYV